MSGEGLWEQPERPNEPTAEAPSGEGRTDGVPEVITSEEGIQIDLTTDERFWEEDILRNGMVLEFTLQKEEARGGDECRGAVMIKDMQVDEFGVWLEVKPMGASADWGWKALVNHISRRKQRIHLCRRREGVCPLPNEPGFHVTELKIFGLAIMPLDYVDKKRRKEWEEYLQSLVTPEKERPGRRGERNAEADALDRIGILRKRFQESRGITADSSRKVTFRGEEQQQGERPQTLLRALAAPIKEEKAAVEISSDESRRGGSSKKKKNVQSLLMRAATLQVQKKGKEDGRKKKRRSRSRSRGRRKKRRRSRSSSTSSYSSESSGCEPPLQRMATKKPGSVLRLLHEHVAAALNQAGVQDEDAGLSSLAKKATTVSTYLQVLVKRDLGSKVRDARELETLARCIDLLGGGQLAEVGDTLAGRFIAVEAAALQGSWHDAQYLEVLSARTPGVAQANVLLKAQRHARTVDRASGRGSWSRRQGWQPQGNKGQSPGEGGRGKGKGGKTKTKGKKGNKKGAWTEKPQTEGAEATS